MKLLALLPDIMKSVEDDNGVVLLFRDVGGDFVVVLQLPAPFSQREIMRAPSLMALAQQMMA